MQARAPEPPAPWREALVHELQALRTFRVNDQPMTTQFGARFAYGADVVDVLFAIHANAVVVAWHGGSVMIASLGTHREDVLRLLAEALPGYPEIAAALRHDAPVGEGRPAGAGTGRAEWQLHDCTGPAQGEFVYYEEEPKPVMNPAPAFPPGIVSRHRGERIIVHALVGVEGKICTVKIMRGTPPATESVVRALREWRFTPARSAGQPVAVWVEIPFVVGT